MEALAQIYVKHSGPGKFNDKGSIHSYLPAYEELLRPYRETCERVVEIGIYDGHSWRMFSEYFHNADVHGIDCDEQPHGGKADLRPLIAEFPHRIHIFDATDEVMVEEKFGGGNSFSVIIDDAAHNLDQQVKLFSIWGKRLAPGGLYVIEDVQAVDESRVVFEALGFEIMDLRSKKKRYDDVLCVYRKGA